MSARWLSAAACTVLACSEAGRDDDVLPVDARASGDETSSCPHGGPPVIDPASRPPCCPGAHCLPATVIDPALAADLAVCAADPTQLCVPDDFIASAGQLVPATCVSLLGAEGRCLSSCLPRIAAQGDALPRSTCAETERCAPCYDPTTGDDTGACRVSCDPGPTQPPTIAATCCHGDGHCIPPESAGADADQLGMDTCSAGLLCAPDVLATHDYVAMACETVLLAALFGDAYRPGACLPDCLPAVSNVLLGQDGCATGYKCAPCLDPIGQQPTGACDFLPPAP
jgi:hypothetical protein